MWSWSNSPLRLIQLHSDADAIGARYARKEEEDSESVLTFVGVLEEGTARASYGRSVDSLPARTALLVLLASVLSARITYPFACDADFRFAVPVLVPFILASARGRRLPQALLAVMAISSVVFFVSL